MNKQDFPAFPTWEMGGQGPEPSCDGLTKREWFAAMAMSGLLSQVDHNSSPATWDADATGMARAAIRCADALIAELYPSP